MKKLVSLLFAAVLFSFVSQAQTITGSWSGELEVGPQKLGIIFHFNRAQDGRMLAFMDVPAQSAKGIPANISVLTADSVSVSVPAIGMTYSGRLTDGIIRGSFTQMGMSFQLDLKPGAQDKPKRPQEPQGELPYNTTELVIRNEKADVSLSGTLSYPAGYVKGQNVPVVVMVTGSGGENRDEEVYEHKPFLVIADYLARNGVASFRYDDRGIGKSTGQQYGGTTADFADDTEAAVEYLKGTGEFDKVGVLGHSEGGLIAFILAGRGKADFIVSLAGPGIKGDTLLTEQSKAISKLNGIEYNATTAQTREQVRVSGSSPWLDYFLDYDPKSDLEKITVPVMALNGANDVQVISKSNLKAIESALSGKNRHNVFREYPDLNHLFQHCTPQTSMDYYEIEETFSPEVLEDIAEWIKSLYK